LRGLFELKYTAFKPRHQSKICDMDQDNIYQKIYELTNALQAERERHENISNSLRELSAELKVKQNQIEQQTVSIAHLNAAIKAKDSTLAKTEKFYESIHQKLDVLLARNG
jgi:chromosome segregation ATPase